MVQAMPHHHSGARSQHDRRAGAGRGVERPPTGRTHHHEHGAEFPCRRASLSTNAARQGGSNRDRGGDDVGGKLYSENNVTALKGYCGVANPAGIPTIWDAFQQTKEIASHHHNLQVGMSKWSKDTGKDINKAPFFTEQTIKDIVNLSFNLGEVVPTFNSAQRGISILMCRPKSAHKVEAIKDFKEARRATAHTAQFNEVRRRQKAPPNPPPDNYFQLRLSVNTFCALSWMLFGGKCDY
jgi:hypothetical protein